MQIKSNILSTLRLIGLLALLTGGLVACNVLSTPEEEEITFEGAPDVLLASPVEGDTYREGVGVSILMRVNNAGPDIVRVSIEVDGEIIGEVLNPNTSGAPSFDVENSWTAMGVGEHTITANAFRADSSLSDSESATINVVAAPNNNTTSDDTSTETDTDTDTSSDDDTTNTETDTTTNTSSDDASDDDDTASSQGNNQQAAPTNPPLPSPVPSRTPVPPSPAPPTATATPTAPQVSVVTGANVRSGPGTVFDPPIGSLAAGATAEILAVNPAGTWYRISVFNSSGWISGLVVEVQGDISGLPREAGPPTPVPPTPVPPTNTPLPASQVDLIIDAANSRFVPTFACGQTSQITITVVNQGTDTSPGGTVVIQDIEPNGNVGETTQTVFGQLAPNQSQTINAALTVTTFVGEVHTFRAIVDGNNQINESNENNNRWEEVYTLEPGSC